MKIVDNIQILLGKKKSIEKPPIEPKRKVLIVEDDTSLAGALRDAFTEADFIVLLAGNGKEGLEIAKQQKPNCIVLDLMMPVMDGKVMLTHLREVPEFKLLPVVVLTNAGQVDNIKETVDYDRAIEFLIKSNVTLEEVVEKVKRVY